MKELASTDAFTVAVDPGSNRIYLKIVGTWKQSDADAYAQGVRSAFKAVKPGFTLVIDMRKAAPAMPWIQEVTLTLQKEAVAAGVGKAAEVYDRHVVTRDQRAKIAEKSGMVRQAFDNMDKAVQWLDMP